MSFLFKNNKRRAFTFIELIIVILIISLVTTVAIASVNVIKRSARDKKVLSEIKEFQMALEAYKMIEGGYPDTEVIEGGGQIIGSNGSVFYNNIPSNIIYYKDLKNDYYSLEFFLEGSIDNYSSGLKCLDSNDVVHDDCHEKVIVDGLVGFWKFDEGEGQTAFDYTRNNDVFVGNNTIWGFNPYSIKPKYSGNSPSGNILARAYYQEGNEFDFGTYDDFTIVTWMKMNEICLDDVYSRNAGVVSKGKGGTGFGINIQYNNLTTNIIDIYAVIRGDGIHRITDRYSIDLNDWYQAVMTYSGTGQSQVFSFYLNGQNWSTKILNEYAKIDNINDLTFGSGSWGNGIIGGNPWNFLGEIGRTRIYNRVLSADEILQLYNHDYQNIYINY